MTKGDLLSREAVIDILDYWYDKDSSNYVEASKSISELPSVEPKQDSIMFKVYKPNPEQNGTS